MIEELTDLPVFQDGSDGSLWECSENEWARILSGEIDGGQRFLKVSDVIKLLKAGENE
jgi:hypothetical protein